MAFGQAADRLKLSCGRAAPTASQSRKGWWASTLSRGAMPWFEGDGAGCGHAVVPLRRASAGVGKHLQGAARGLWSQGQCQILGERIRLITVIFFGSLGCAFFDVEAKMPALRAIHAGEVGWGVIWRLF